MLLSPYLFDYWYPEAGKRPVNKHELSRFFLSFLDDAAIHPPIPASSPTKTCFTWPASFEVRNFAAGQLAAMFKYTPISTTNKTAEEWREFREKVRTQADKFLAADQ